MKLMFQRTVLILGVQGVLESVTSGNPLPTVCLPSRLCLSRWQITCRSVCLCVHPSVYPSVTARLPVWASRLPYMNLPHVNEDECSAVAPLRLSLCFCTLKSPSSSFFFFFHFFLFMFFNLRPLLFPLPVSISICLSRLISRDSCHSHASYRWVAMTMRLRDQILKISLPFPPCTLWIYLFIKVTVKQWWPVSTCSGHFQNISKLTLYII